MNFDHRNVQPSAALAQPPLVRVERFLAAALFLFTASIALFAQGGFDASPDGNTIEVQDEPDMQVVAVSKSVNIRISAKDVFVFGGDVTVEGRVAGDVIVFGGSIVQKEGGFIGGDVIVFGGEYRAEGGRANRVEGKQTIVFGILEKELRELGSDPSQILSPSLSPAFFAQRLLSVLFWFVVSLILTTLAPGAVGRGIARIRLGAAKTAGLGLAGLIGATILMSVGVAFLPEFLSAMTTIMVLGLVLLAYLFGRIVIQLSLGKYILKFLSSARTQSEVIANLIGAFVTTLVLSLPYIWPVALIILFSAGIGLVLTARTGKPWRTA